MILLRSLSAELLKLRRTLAFWMVFAAPLLIAFLSLVLYYERSAYYLKQSQPLWTSLLNSAFVLWTILMLPLYVTLESALLAGLEHGENRWRNLLALPVPRWSIYLSKLIIPCTMVLVSSVVLNTASVVNGLILRQIKPALRFPDPAPWGTILPNSALMLAAALFVIAVQHWISLRVRTFAGSAGVGIAATITGFLLINSARLGPWWPWCLPAQLLATRPEAVTHALWYSGIGAAAATIVGAIEFSRREISS